MGFVLTKAVVLPPPAQSMDAVFVDIAPQAAPLTASESVAEQESTQPEEQGSGRSTREKGAVATERVMQAAAAVEAEDGERSLDEMRGVHSAVTVDRALDAGSAVERRAQEGTSTAQPKAIPKGQPVETWQARLLDHMKRHRRYPRQAERRGLQGITYVRFTVDRDGQVTGVGMAASSGNESLDAEAMATVSRASPMPAPPADLPLLPLEVVLPIDFSLAR